MEIQEHRAECRYKFAKVAQKIYALSDKYFNVVAETFNFDNSFRQTMFHVKPLDKWGVEMPIEFCFTKYTEVENFTSKYHVHHTIEFWKSTQQQHHKSDVVEHYLWNSRVQMKGGEE